MAEPGPGQPVTARSRPTLPIPLPSSFRPRRRPLAVAARQAALLAGLGAIACGASTLRAEDASPSRPPSDPAWPVPGSTDGTGPASAAPDLLSPSRPRAAPPAPPPVLPAPDPSLPIELEADRLSGSPDREAVAEGDVQLRRGDLHLRADRLRYDVADDRARAEGQVVLESGGDRFCGTELEMKLQAEQGYVLDPTYFFSRTGGGGRADRIDVESRNRARLAGATYSSCLPDGSGAPAWVLQTDKVRLDFDRNEGLAQGAVLRFYGVPLLAAPVLTFPLSDERKTGWLPPSLGLDSKSGFEWQQPWYWNIAPDRDLTLTPILTTRRGLGVDGELRYLAPSDQGRLGWLWFPDDRVARRSRYGLDFRHAGGDPGTLDYSATVVRVSDDDYWKDFSRPEGVLTPRLLPTDLRAGRSWPTAGIGTFTSYARMQRWQVLQDSDPSLRIVSPYQRVPQLGMRHVGDFGALRWAGEAEYNRFTLPGDDVDSEPARLTGQRLHFLGRVSLPYETPGWTLTPSVSVNAASYDLEQPMADGRRRASRVIPTVSLDSTWVLERDTTFFGRSFQQTLEPRVLYSNTPYRAQDDLPNFDSAARDFNFDSIYTENAFSGIDRVSDAHQVTAGVTSRLIDPVTGGEALRVALMQRFLLSDQRITPDGEPLTKRFSDILLLGSTSVVPNWKFDATLRYNPDIDRSIRSIVGVRYNPGPFRTIGATYRFARGLSEQLDMGWQWPIYRSDASSSKLMAPRSGPGCSGTWYSVGRVNYSMRDSRVTDSLLGLEYDAGCWIGRVVAERLSTGRSEATTRFMVQLELVGLSRLGINPLAVLKDNIPGYRLLRDDPDALDDIPTAP